MNERIRALAKQATKTLDVKHEGYRGKGYTEQVEFFDPEKFAELIIQECAITVIDRCEMRNADDVRRAEYHAKRIKQHFGVEE